MNGLSSPCEATAGPHQETGSRTQALSRDSPPTIMCPHRAPSPAHPVCGQPAMVWGLLQRPRLGQQLHSMPGQLGSSGLQLPAHRGGPSPPLSSAAAAEPDPWIWTMA